MEIADLIASGSKLLIDKFIAPVTIFLDLVLTYSRARVCLSFLRRNVSVIFALDSAQARILMDEEIV
ncbi:hypothetical protein RBB79_16530 [Tunturiibacter empetritectus]|uniref:Uncharacterized protein n=2 Tax=Tunturiibacter TaxID=3154218 RepID=A0A852VHQ9_9BACT|nr:hypothetical protein [Edaphobacter lichenicola]NYF91227.1 hypothetical protein [Edaphobacter lichenicola]